MPAATADLHDVVFDLVHNGRTWCGSLPPEFGDTSTRRRLEGAAFSVLVMIDGDAGPGPVRLSPKDNPDLDLGGDALHELLGSEADCDTDAQRDLLSRLQRLVDEHAERPDPVEVVMGQFLAAVCRMLADGYELRLVDTDVDTGAYLGARDDVAADLPAAFQTRWAEVRG
ncbi:MAG TPA: hypothetical protein VJT31_02410 [Rugosimonospora sp.]|nr:hypothetical protein [Rugosimonospora sp.]